MVRSSSDRASLLREERLLALGDVMPILKPIDRQRLISEYVDAFLRANPDAKTPIVAYLKPFYRFKAAPENEWEMKKYRPRELQRMLKNLRERSATN